MGTWGPGNFENDRAADYLAELCQPIVEQIQTAIDDPPCLEPDEPESAIVMANIELLSSIFGNMERYASGPIEDVLFPDILPRPETVSNWKSIYLRVWDGYIDQLNPKPEHKKNRRIVIAKSFDRLVQVSKSVMDA